MGFGLVLVATAATDIVYQRRSAQVDAREDATAAAEFGARIAARDIASAIELAQTSVATTAATPGLEEIIAAAPADCTLRFTRPGTFSTGHVDIVRKDGTVACTSLLEGRESNYTDAPWHAAAHDGTATVHTVVDERTGKQVVVVAAPVGDLGTVAAFLDLDSLGPGLASAFGGPRRLEFLVVSEDAETVITRSIDPSRWVGMPLEEHPFSLTGSTSQADLDGTSRLYGRATVDGLGWQVFAGANTAEATAAAQRLSNRQLELTLSGLTFLLAALWLLYRRIARPIATLSTQVRAATEGATGPIVVAGPGEVATLVDAFNELIAAANRELEATTQLAAIVESSADAMIGRTLDGQITSWNAGAEQMYGYPAAEMIGRADSSIVPTERADEIDSVLERVRRGDRVEPFDTTRVRKDGSVVEVSVRVSAVRDSDDHIIGSSSVARDISVTKRAVDALRVSEARKTAMLESALDAVMSIDAEGNLVDFNPAAERVFGYAKKEVVGQSMADLIIPAALREEHRAGLARYLTTGEAHVLGQRLEVTAVRSDGEEIPVELAITRVDLPGPPLFIGYLRDMSEQHRQATELKALNDRRYQSERLESLGQLAGGIAHDFNNLLAAIMNYATFVADGTADRPEVLRDVQEIQVAAERAARLTRQLLIFGRRGATQPETLAINSIVAEIRNLLSRSIGPHIDLRIDSEPGLPGIRGDQGQIEQVLLNLAVNARDAMPNGGILTIATAAVELDERYTHLHPEVRAGRYVELAVSDTGTGMSAAVVARIFEPFFTTKPVGEGTGLGLATVYGIVAAAGGAMTVSSTQGLGTTFRLYFPITDLPMTEPPAEPADDVRGHGETVLVVEDDRSVLTFTSRILRQNGYNVLEASTFHEALSLAARHDFQVLLTDSVMPEMSGRVLAERIDELQPGKQVLYMSGYSEVIVGARRVPDDGVTIIQKPFNRRTLLDHVGNALRPGDPTAPTGDGD